MLIVTGEVKEALITAKAPEVERLPIEMLLGEDSFDDTGMRYIMAR